MNMVTQKNIGALGVLVRAGAASTLAAGGAGDNAAVIGVGIDRETLGVGYGAGSVPYSALFGVAYTATLAAGKTLSNALLIEDSADGTNWATYQTIASAQAAISAAGGTVTGVQNFQVFLGSARRWVRFTWTPDLNASGTDTASIFPMLFLGGFDHLPVT
jgi:hypothetical protein